MPVNVEVLTVSGPHEAVMVVDTACHVNVTSETWMEEHRSLLRDVGLDVGMTGLNQTFKFGEGTPHHATNRFVFPAAIDESPLLIRAFTLDQPIPFLGSRPCLEALGFVMNSITKTCVFLRLDPSREVK